MRRARRRNWGKKTSPCHVEEHHIFPVSIFGPNKKTVCLTAREHYVAHALLYKALKKRYGSNHSRAIKMRYAYWAMSNGQIKNRYVNSRLYEKLKEEFSKAQSLRMSGKNHPMWGKTGENSFWWGKTFSPEHKKKIGGAAKLRTRENSSWWGKTRSSETKKKISESTRGKKHSMWGKVGHRKGMKNGSEHRAKISQSRRKKLGNIWEVVDPDGNKYICESLKEFCKKYNLHSGHMYRVASGRLKQHKGWLVKNSTC